MGLRGMGFLFGSLDRKRIVNLLHIVNLVEGWLV